MSRFSGWLCVGVLMVDGIARASAGVAHFAVARARALCLCVSLSLSSCLCAQSAAKRVSRSAKSKGSRGGFFLRALALPSLCRRTVCLCTDAACAVPGQEPFYSTPVRFRFPAFVTAIPASCFLVSRTDHPCMRLHVFSFRPSCHFDINILALFYHPDTRHPKASASHTHTHTHCHNLRLPPPKSAVLYRATKPTIE